MKCGPSVRLESRDPISQLHQHSWLLVHLFTHSPDVGAKLGEWEPASSCGCINTSISQTPHLSSERRRSICRTSCGSWILEHFDNTGKKRCSGRGRGGGTGLCLCLFPGGSNGLQRVRKSPFTSPLLSSSPIMDTKQISFKERPDRVPFYLIIWIQGEVTLFSLLWWVFFVQIVVDPHAPLRRFVLSSVQCAFLLFILRLRLWIAPLFLVGPFYFLLFLYFCFWKLSLAGFYKGTKPKSPQKFPCTSHHVEFVELLRQLLFPCFLLVGQSVYAI